MDEPMLRALDGLATEGGHAHRDDMPARLYSWNEVAGSAYELAFKLGPIVGDPDQGRPEAARLLLAGFVESGQLEHIATGNADDVAIVARWLRDLVASPR